MRAMGDLNDNAGPGNSFVGSRWFREWWERTFGNAGEHASMLRGDENFGPDGPVLEDNDTIDELLRKCGASDNGREH